MKLDVVLGIRDTRWIHGTANSLWRIALTETGRLHSTTASVVCFANYSAQTLVSDSWKFRGFPQSPFNRLPHFTPENSTLHGEDTPPLCLCTHLQYLLPTTRVFCDDCLAFTWTAVYTAAPSPRWCSENWAALRRRGSIDEYFYRHAPRFHMSRHVWLHSKPLFHVGVAFLQTCLSLSSPS
jgi:hypothetical protein